MRFIKKNLQNVKVLKISEEDTVVFIVLGIVRLTVNHGLRQQANETRSVMAIPVILQ